jgi:hypothetical protein
VTDHDDNEARPIDYLAHEAGYINRHGEELECVGDSYVDDVDAYPYGDCELVCG